MCRDAKISERQHDAQNSLDVKHVLALAGVNGSVEGTLSGQGDIWILKQPQTVSGSSKVMIGVKVVVAIIAVNS